MAKEAEFRAKVTADDQATPTFEKVEKEGEQLDKLDPTVRIKAVADTGAATGEVRDLVDAVEKADGKAAKVKADVDTSGLDELKGKLGDLPGPIGEIAGSLGGVGGNLLGAVGPAGAVAGALFAAADNAADVALSAQTMADLTGASVEEASRLQTVWGRTGAEANDLNDVLLQMNGVLQQNPETAKQLSVNLNDGKNIAARFVEVVDKIQHSTLGASEKAQLMSQAFGEEGVRQVQGLVTLIGGDLQDAVQGVSDTKVINDKDVEDAKAYKQNMAELQETLGGLAITLGQSVLPAVVEVTNALNALPLDLLSKLSGFTVPVPTSGDVGKLSDFATALGESAAVQDAVAKSSEAAAAAGTKLADATTAALAPTDAYGRSLSQVQDDLDRAKTSQAQFAKEYEAESKRIADQSKKESDALHRVSDALDDQADALLQTVDGMRDYADASKDLTDKQQDLADTIAESSKVQQDGESTQADRTRAIRDERDALIDVADATVTAALKQAEAEGKTVTATEKLDTFNSSLLANANYATPAAKQAIADYIVEANGIPDEKATEIKAAINRGDLAEANRLLNEASGARDASINAEAHTKAAQQALDAAAAGPYTANIKVNLVGGAGGGLSGLSRLFGKSGTATTTVNVPAASEIAAMIGPVRVPVDAYVRSTPRVTGIRL